MPCDRERMFGQVLDRNRRVLLPHQIPPSHRLGDVPQVLPHGLRVVQVAGLHHDDRLSVEFNGLTDYVVLLRYIRVAVKPPAHAVEVHGHLGRLMEPIRPGGDAEGRA